MFFVVLFNKRNSLYNYKLYSSQHQDTFQKQLNGVEKKTEILKNALL